ncbi:hypothetical protein [Methylobacterium planeticum]|uniref:hypothetical protein n=1 Tax=Methylobacterium planeticum TaxID=2615211 RepID=UPI001782F5FC|nr:hypothetical protein [Methylobacterium planeticum]
MTMTDDRMALIERIETEADGDLVRVLLAFAAERSPMPIRREHRSFDSIDWPRLSAVIRFRRAGAAVRAADARMGIPSTAAMMAGRTQCAPSASWTSGSMGARWISGQLANCVCNSASSCGRRVRAKSPCCWSRTMSISEMWNKTNRLF